MILLEPGRIIASRYRLERALARGGMGSVWLGRHLQLDADVAIKLIAPEHAASSDARMRFEREAKISAQLKAPNVVHVYDYGIEDDTPYIVMELLAGEDLEARLRREGHLSPAATLSIARQVCKALRRAHEVGLVHRDLKPGNIFLARQGEEEIVKILDFGIAKDTGLGLVGKVTRTGTLIGSPQYMSPEQVRRSKELDHRSDLWSLGVIIFQCLTGRLPFPSEEIGDLLVEICTEDIPLASSVAPGLGPDVDQFLTRALRREPEQRFQSAQELAEAFAAVVEGGTSPRAALPSAPGPGTGPGRPSALASTFAPSGNSLAEAPRPRYRAGIVLSLVGGAATLGIVVATLLRAARPGTGATQEREAAPPPVHVEESSSAVAAAPPAPPPPPSASAAASAMEDPEAPGSTPAAASPGASASAPAAPPPSRKRPPSSKSPPRPPHDPLDHM